MTSAVGFKAWADSLTFMLSRLCAVNSSDSPLVQHLLTYETGSRVNSDTISSQGSAPSERFSTEFLPFTSNLFYFFQWHKQEDTVMQ